MYRSARTPAWQRDLTWIAGIVLVCATLTTVTAAAWSRIAAPPTGPEALQVVLRAALLPEASEGSALQVRTDAGIQAGVPVAVLPGSDVHVDPSELAGFAPEDGVQRIAGVWSERILSQGSEALLASLAGEAATSARRALAGPALRAVAAELSRMLLPTGLADGSRHANWPLQAQQNPGDPVQPVVGIFVTIDPSELQGATTRQVGEAVVQRLAEVTLQQGAEAARETITNATLGSAYEAGVVTAREALHEVLALATAARSEEIEARLQEAVARNAPSDAATVPRALLTSTELAELNPNEANERIVAALTERIRSDGTAALPDLLPDPAALQRVQSARGLVTALAAPAAARARTVAWLAGALALAAWLVMAFTTRGPGRWLRPGMAVLVGVAPLAALLLWWYRAVEGWRAAGWPAGLAQEGAFGQIAGLLRALAASLPAAAATAAATVAIVAAAIAALAILIGLVVAVVQAARPPQRAF